MNTKIMMAVLASVSLALAAIFVTAPSMTSPVFAGDDKDDDHDDHDDHDDKKSHGCKKYSQGYFSSDKKCFHKD